MEPKRGHLEICRDILKVARAGAKITPIIYRSNINNSIANKNIKQMEANGLITVEMLPGGGGRHKLYTTTEKGLAFIEALNETMNIYPGLTPLGSVGPI